MTIRLQLTCQASKIVTKIGNLPYTILAYGRIEREFYLPIKIKGWEKLEKIHGQRWLDWGTL